MKVISATLFATAALVAGCSSMYPASTPDTPTHTADGVLIGPTGKTLYTFARDTPGTSACNDACATNWPALTAPADAKPMGPYSVIMRVDGKKQWAYKGAPLYYWSKDIKAGDRTGDGFAGGAWKVARP